MLDSISELWKKFPNTSLECLAPFHFIVLILYLGIHLATSSSKIDVKYFYSSIMALTSKALTDDGLKQLMEDESDEERSAELEFINITD